MATMTIEYAKILAFSTPEKTASHAHFFLFHKTFACATVDYLTKF